MEHYEITIMVDNEYHYEAENVLDTVFTASKAIFQDEKEIALAVCDEQLDFGNIILRNMDLEIYDELSGVHMKKYVPTLSQIRNYLDNNSLHIENYDVERLPYYFTGYSAYRTNSDFAAILGREDSDPVLVFYSIDGWMHKRVKVDVYSDLNTLREIDGRLKETFDDNRLHKKYTWVDSVKDTTKNVTSTIGSWWDAAKDFYKEKVKSRLPGGKEEEELI